MFEGEIDPYYVVGFSAVLYEDDGTDTDATGRGRDMQRELYGKLSGTGEAGGECGENLYERVFDVLVGEDCSGRGPELFPVYSVGEPYPESDDYPNLWITDLNASPLLPEDRFPGESLTAPFCGGLGRSDDCAATVLNFMQDADEEHCAKLYARLERQPVPEFPYPDSLGCP